MASRKALKKDINYLYADLLTECFKLSIVSPAENHEKIKKFSRELLLFCACCGILIIHAVMKTAVRF